ncbi:histidine phosphatase family protein [Oligoflexia bacterium]|nr:histidine phosphatase family protein [Oligoflexia bacterium]
MEIILARHGNTFNPGDKIVWVGSSNDLPLVEKGEQQARELATALSQAPLKPTAIYCGPLQRTARYAELMIEELGVAVEPTVDLRIDEVDYGEWSGLSNAEVADHFSAQELEAWNKCSKWPTSGVWRSSEKEVIKNVFSFAEDIARWHSATDVVIVVSSNGVLRYFLKLIEREFETRIQTESFKMKTGSISKLDFDGYNYKIAFWNVKPQELLRTTDGDLCTGTE